MVYGIIGVALLCLTVKGYCGKRTSSAVRHTGDAYLFNLLRMLLCMLIGIVLVCAEGAQGFLRLEGGMLAICALAGVANAAFLVSWLFAVQKNAMVSVDVSLTLGSLLPSVLCALLFHEPLSWAKMIGFALIVFASVILAGHSKQTVGSSGSLGFLLLIFATVGDGLSNFAQQLYKQYYTEVGSLARGVYYPKTVYHFYTYVFAALTLALILLGYSLYHRGRAASARDSADPSPRSARSSLSPRILGHIFIMAVCLFAANYFQTVATNDYGVSSQMLYPIIKGGCLITVNFTAMLFFHERITRRSMLGSLIALAGIVCMSLL